MSKKEPEKKALKAIDKAVKKAMKHGVTGGLVDQTVASSIHAARVKAARKDAPANKEVAKAEKAGSSKKISKAVKREGKDDAGTESLETSPHSSQHLRPNSSQTLI